MRAPAELVHRWREHWPRALRAWGRFVMVHDPLFCATSADARRAGLHDSFAMFRLDDRTVVLDLAQAHRLGLGDLAVEVMAHEVGHHVLCPADLSDGARLLARVRTGLGELREHAPLIANMYADLLINDRLQRSRGLRMDEVYRRLRAASTAQSPLWTLYMRIYEILWSLPTGTLARAALDPAVDGDAHLGARLARVYATDWLDGAGGFAVLVYRYLAEESATALTRIRLEVCAGAVGPGAQVPGLTEGDPDPVVHPALDPMINDFAGRGAPDDEPEHAQPPKPTGQQYREPFEYGQILRQLGLSLSEQDAAIRYYRERAAPHLVRFPVRRHRVASEPLLEGLDTWDVGEAVEDVDWLSSTLRSPVVVPGVTTVQRVYGSMPAAEPEQRPVDLDLYVDSSGSMPDPRRSVSYLTLAGAILASSALRVGARVQCTLWSGAGEFLCTDGFVRDDTAVMRVLTGYFGGATAFPLHVLRDTYRDRRREGTPTHIVVISDNGVDTMIESTDEQGRPGGEVAASALSAAGAGGTLVLNLWSDREERRIAALTPGWELHRVGDWTQLVDFARAFSRTHYDRSKR